MGKQNKLTKSARGKSCTLRLGECSSDETVILCHIGKIRGIAFKCADYFAVYGCYNCHEVIDGRRKSPFSKHELSHEKLRALEETQSIMVDEGLLNVVS